MGRTAHEKEERILQEFKDEAHASQSDAALNFKNLQQLEARYHGFEAAAVEAANSKLAVSYWLAEREMQEITHALVTVEKGSEMHSDMQDRLHTLEAASS